MLHIGQKVVCISNLSARGAIYGGNLRIGSVYTIRNIYTSPRGRVVVNLHGKQGPFTRSGYEKGFRPEIFRPVIDKKTDISIFTDMLKDVRTPIDA